MKLTNGENLNKNMFGVCLIRMLVAKIISSNVVFSNMCAYDITKTVTCNNNGHVIFLECRKQMKIRILDLQTRKSANSL